MRRLSGQRPDLIPIPVLDRIRSNVETRSHPSPRLAGARKPGLQPLGIEQSHLAEISQSHSSNLTKIVNLCIVSR
jgi:hypothetical protein